VDRGHVARGVYRPEGWPKHTTTHTAMHTAAHAALAVPSVYGNGFIGNILSFDERKTPNDKRGKNRKY
jgi:hypothetical protein